MNADVVLPDVLVGVLVAEGVAVVVWVASEPPTQIDCSVVGWVVILGSSITFTVEIFDVITPQLLFVEKEILQK